MIPRPINVTDHAVVRYLERVEGIDMAAARRRNVSGDCELVRMAEEEFGRDVADLRRQIAERVTYAMDLGACGTVQGGWRYVLRPASRAVVTVTRPTGCHPHRSARP